MDNILLMNMVNPLIIYFNILMTLYIYSLLVAFSISYYNVPTSYKSVIIYYLLPQLNLSISFTTLEHYD